MTSQGRLILTAVETPAGRGRCRGGDCEITASTCYQDQYGYLYCAGCAGHLTTCTDETHCSPSAVYAGEVGDDEILILTAVIAPGRKCSGHLDEIPFGAAYEDQYDSLWCLACAKHMTACTDEDCDHPAAVFSAPNPTQTSSRTSLRGEPQERNTAMKLRSCPAWCTTDHITGVVQAHMSESLEVPISLVPALDPASYPGAAPGTPDAIEVFVWLSDQPRPTVSVGRISDDTFLPQLTPDEADELAERLRAAARQARQAAA